MVCKWMRQWVVPSALVMASGLANSASAQVSVVEIEAEETGAHAKIVEAAREAAEVAKERAVIAVRAAVEEANAAQEAAVAHITGKFWLGLACEPVSEALQAQMSLESGLCVQEIVPDGPAAQAKIQRFDVLLKFNEEKLTGIEQLMQLVDKNEGKPINFTLLRGGKEQLLTVSPVERPKTPAVATATVTQGLAATASDREAAELRIANALKKLSEANRDVEMLIVRPGVAFPADRVKPFAWPKDTSISIDKDGDKPAQITIKRGEQAWKVTEDRLSELPPEVRELIERMRGGGAVTVHKEFAPSGEAVQTLRLFSHPAEGARLKVQALPAEPGQPVITARPVPPTAAVPSVPDRVTVRQASPSPAIEKQLGELNRKLDKLLGDERGDAVKQLEAEVKRLREQVDALREAAK